MTVLEALVILESAVLECKKRDADRPNAGSVRLFRVPYLPRWLIPQYREHVLDHDRTDVALEGQQHVLRATFPGIRDAVREPLRVRLDALARKFDETNDMNVKEEIERLGKE